jgi:hypothetical protein
MRTYCSSIPILFFCPRKRNVSFSWVLKFWTGKGIWKHLIGIKE